jgi:hypothetical protein
MHLPTQWSRMVRTISQYIALTFLLAVVGVEIAGVSFGSPALELAYDYLLAIVFSLFTIAIIAMCGWIVFLWDIDRLFFRLEGRIDAQINAESASGEPDASLVGRAREMLESKVQDVRARAAYVIEKSYWDDINTSGLLEFPQPNIAAAVRQIDESRRDLLAPLSDFVATSLPLGASPAAIVARMIFRYVAPEVKVRLYRRLILRFLLQLGSLFALAATAFYFSILGWSRIASSVFTHGHVDPTNVLLYQLDLMLRGAVFDFMEHTQRSISPIRINQNATAFVYYTLLFRMFVAVYVTASLFKVIRFVARRWRALLR